MDNRPCRCWNETQEWYWLGQVHYWFAFIAVRLGDFDRALQSAARTEELGQTIGDRDLQCRGAMMAQLTYVTQGEWSAAIIWGQRALNLATGLQSDVLDLGVAGLRSPGAKARLRKAVALRGGRAVQHFTCAIRQIWGWFAAWLGEAYAAAGRLEEARAQVLRGIGPHARSRVLDWHRHCPTLPGPRRAGQRRAHRGREPSPGGTTDVHRARLSTRSGPHPSGPRHRDLCPGEYGRDRRASPRRLYPVYDITGSSIRATDGTTRR